MLLMALSVALAVALPFEIFLLSYAILGPLHYATEISWLHKKEYFASGNKDGKIFLILCTSFTALILAILFWKNLQDSAPINWLITNLNIDKKLFTYEIGFWPGSLVFLSIAAAFILTFVKDWWFRINACVVAALIVFIFRYSLLCGIFFTALLTTVIHVWIFTGIFILSGAKRTKNIISYISFAFFLLCSLSFIFLVRSDYTISNYAAKITQSGNLDLNGIILQILNVPFEKENLISSSAGLKIQGFIAFAYTYHYLNWFSKVEIIKWHKVSKRALILSGILWIISISLYAYDYQLGGSLLLFLSILHVFLEFPLNMRSIASLVKK